MKIDTILFLVVVFVMWLLKLLFDTFAKYWIQEGIVKPATNKIISFWKEWKFPKKLSDRQVVMICYFIMAVVFAAVTLQMSAIKEHDFLNRLVILLSAITTCVSVVFLGLVYANVRVR